MNRDKRDKRESEYPVQLESQFIVRMPEEPGKVLSDLIKSGENFKNRLTIQIYDDMRHGEVRLDHWLLQSKIVDLPTIVESWKTIDKKSLYKTADICQMMICKDKFEESTDDESLTKNKKKDPLKVDKKYLWPHGVTPPTKNIRRRRFRKTLKKKCAEAPEIEKEVKRLLRADNEAISFTWEVVQEEDANVTKNEPKDLPKTKGKKDILKNAPVSNKPSKVEDIFGGALSDSDVEDENVNVEVEDYRQPSYNESLCDINTSHELEVIKKRPTATKVKSEMTKASRKTVISHESSSSAIVDNNPYYGIDSRSHQQASTSGLSNMSSKLQELATDLEELKQRRQKTQLEISRLENVTLRQRFQDILKTINKDIIMKEMEYHKLKSRTK